MPRRLMVWLQFYLMPRRLMVWLQFYLMPRRPFFILLHGTSAAAGVYSYYLAQRRQSGSV